MTKETESKGATRGGQFTAGIERVWNEIKQISRQVERETKRSGRVARLRLDLRQLRRQRIEVRARLGKAVFEAQVAGGTDLKLQEVEGFAGGVAALDKLEEQIRATEEEIEQLRASGEDAPATSRDEVAEEAASG